MSRSMNQATPLYFRSYLAPLQPFLEQPDVTDVYVNRPGEVWTESLSGTILRHEVAALDTVMLDRLARQIAALSHQGISREHPLLAATLPDGSRIQMVAAPATRGPLALAIRKHVASDMTLADLSSSGAFAETRGVSTPRQEDADTQISAHYETGDYEKLLSVAVKARKNIIIAGGTSTGKTTVLNALIAEIPRNERLILIEDTPELLIQHDNALCLVAARSALGEAEVTTDDLLSAALRMRPDRIIVGELRGPEAYTFLRAINTGHPGSMTTVHADSPARAIEHIALLILQTGTRLGREDVLHYVRNTVDVYVQLTRDGGKRRVAEIMLQAVPR